MIQFIEEIDSKVLSVFNILSSLKEDFTVEGFLSYSIEKIFEDHTISKMGIVLFENNNSETSLKIKISRGISGEEVKNFHKNYVNDQVFVQKIIKLKSPVLLDLSTLTENPYEILAFNLAEGYLGLFPLKIEGEVKGFLFLITTEALNEVDILVFNSILSLSALIIRYQHLKDRIVKESLYDLTIKDAYNIRFFISQLLKEIDRAKKFNRNLSVAVIEINNYNDILYTNGFIKTMNSVLQIYNFFKSIIRGFDVIALKNNNRQLVIFFPEFTAKEAEELIRKHISKIDEIPFSIKPFLNVGIADMVGSNGNPLEKAEVVLEEAKRGADKTILVSKG